MTLAVTALRSGINLMSGVYPWHVSPEKRHKTLLIIIFLLSASNRASAMQMSKPIVDDILNLEQGIYTYDSYLKTDVFVIAPVLCLLCDNARASELLNHLGSTALCLCRMCNVSCTFCIIKLFIKLIRHKMDTSLESLDLNHRCYIVSEKSDLNPLKIRKKINVNVMA